MKFRKAPALTVALLIMFSYTAYGQFFRNYYYDFKVLNPAFAGIKDKHIITAVYSGFATDEGRSPNFFYGSYETSIPAIKSGVGALATYDRLGAVSKFQSGVFFNKKISFNERSGLRLGTRLSYMRDEIDYSRYQYLHKDDPLLAGREGKEVTSRFNFDLGVLYYSPIVNVGLTVRDVLKQEGQSETTFNAIITREFLVTKSLKITPSVVYRTTYFDSKLIDINSIFEIKQWLLLGGGYVISEGKDHVSFSAGANIKEWVHVIALVYCSDNDDYRERHGPEVEAMVRINIPHRVGKE